MHAYPLHRAVDAECQCCGTDYTTTFTSKSDQVVCKGCVRHQGSDLKSLTQRNADHKALWKSENDLLREENQRRLDLMGKQCDAYRGDIERLGGENEVLRQTIREGFDGAPLEIVQDWLHSEAVVEAHAERDRAFRSRAYAYRALWRAADIHHHDPQRFERCSCGKPASNCRELLAIEDMEDTLNKWEAKQVRRLGGGMDHELPDEHPEVRRRLGRHYRQSH